MLFNILVKPSTPTNRNFIRNETESTETKTELTTELDPTIANKLKNLLGLFAQKKPRFNIQLDQNLYKCLLLTLIDYFNNKIEGNPYDGSQNHIECKSITIGEDIHKIKSHDELTEGFLSTAILLNSDKKGYKRNNSLKTNERDVMKPKYNSKKNDSISNKSDSSPIPSPRKNKKDALMTKTFEISGKNLNNIILSNQINQKEIKEESESEDTKKEKDFQIALKKRKTRVKNKKTKVQFDNPGSKVQFDEPSKLNLNYKDTDP